MSRVRTSGRGSTALAVLLAAFIALDLIGSAPASPIRPPLPRDAGVPHWLGTLARWTGIARLGHGVLVALALVLLVAILGLFAIVCWESWNGRVSIGPVLMVTVASIAIFVIGPLILSRDVYSYASYGRMFAIHGTNPYVTSPDAFPLDPFTLVVSPAWRDTPSVYGPAFSLLSAGIGAVAKESAFGTILIFKLVSGLSIVIATLLAVAAARIVRPEKEVFAAAAVGLNPALVIHVVGGGHNDALVAGLLAGALLLALKLSRPASKGGADGELAASVATGTAALGVTALITLSAMVKIVAALPLILWIGHLIRTGPPPRRFRIAAIHAATAAALTIAVTIPVYAGWNTVKAIANLASREGWASAPRLVARGARAIVGLFGDGSAERGFSVAVYAVFLAVLAVLVWRLFQERGWLPAESWGGALLLLALAAPYLLPWYAAWFLPFLPLMKERRFILVGLVAAGVLSLTGVPAEPGSDPALWRQMMLAVHYAAAPVMLGLFVLAAVRVTKPTSVSDL